jgi:hypothetical protein
LTITINFILFSIAILEDHGTCLITLNDNSFSKNKS